MDTAAAGACWSATGAWTGRQAVLWAGSGHPGGYSPSSDSWVLWPDSSRFYFSEFPTSASWSGRYLNYIATDYGFGDSSECVVYDDSSRTWRVGSSVGAPRRRNQLMPFWNGSGVMLWGGIGYHGGLQRDAYLYDPASDAWTPINDMGAPRYYPGQSWQCTDSEIIVWSGDSNNGTPTLVYPQIGWQYDVALRSWKTISPTNAPPGSDYAYQFWTGSEMLVFGGYHGSLSPVMSGGRLTPAPIVNFGLDPGWNLISVPYSDSTTTRASVLPTVYDVEHYFPPTGEYWPNASASRLEAGVGYWVLAPVPTNVAVEIADTQTVTWNVLAGWNLVGCGPSIVALDSVPGLASAADLSSAYTYDAASGAYVHATTLAPGQGLWLLAPAPATITLPGGP